MFSVFSRSSVFPLLSSHKLHMCTVAHQIRYFNPKRLVPGSLPAGSSKVFPLLFMTFPLLFIPQARHLPAGSSSVFSVFPLLPVRSHRDKTVFCVHTETRQCFPVAFSAYTQRQDNTGITVQHPAYKAGLYLQSPPREAAVSCPATHRHHGAAVRYTHNAHRDKTTQASRRRSTRPTKQALSPIAPP